MAEQATVAAPPKHEQPKARTGIPLPKWDEGKDDPWERPAAYLLNRGWRFQGNMESPNSLWFDPTLPTKNTEKKIRRPIMGTRIDQWEGGPHPLLGGKMMPAGEVRVPCVVREIDTVVVTPAGTPISRSEALLIQLERDCAADQKPR